jgi:hypothetical protein
VTRAVYVQRDAHILMALQHIAMGFRVGMDRSHIAVWRRSVGMRFSVRMRNDRVYMGHILDVLSLLTVSPVTPGDRDQQASIASGLVSI